MVTSAELEKIVDEFTGKTKSVLSAKGKEYSNEDERLENFITIGEATKLLPEQVITVLLMKHCQSIVKGVMEDNYEWAWKRSDGAAEGFKERILDAINYLLLLAAALEERNGNPGEDITNPTAYPTQDKDSYSVGDTVFITGSHWKDFKGNSFYFW